MFTRGRAQLRLISWHLKWGMFTAERWPPQSSGVILTELAFRLEDEEEKLLGPVGPQGPRFSRWFTHGMWVKPCHKAVPWLGMVGICWNPSYKNGRVNNFLWIQPYILRKYDWGMVFQGLSSFSDSVWIHGWKNGLPNGWDFWSIRQLFWNF